jgi:hypothetical protein
LDFTAFRYHGRAAAGTRAPCGSLHDRYLSRIGSDDDAID